MRIEREYIREDSPEEEHTVRTSPGEDHTLKNPPGKDYEALPLNSPHQSMFVVTTHDRCEMNLVGSKALHISAMAREGVTVPEGFCVTTEAYNYFMDFNNISEDEGNIANKIQEGVVPPLLSECVTEAYHTYLHGKPCAVRSSSPFEDLKSASFAGQYKSVLNVKGEDALPDAVKECWASLWSRPATEYRKKMGIENDNIKMAVLVQEMVPATASGILFTEDDMVVEAVWGLGETLVGGKVIPDHIVVERDGFSVREQKISHKEVMSQMLLDGGVEIVEVPEHLKDAPVLKDDHIRNLCSIGEKVEEFFGCPQDIEWALYNDEIILLQARPISVEQSPTVWTRANIAENLPGYVTYLSRTPEGRPDFFVIGISPLLECFGIRDIPEDLKLMDYIYGHIYGNITNAYRVLCRIPGISPKMLDQSIGHSSEVEVPESKLGISDIIKIVPGTLKVFRFFLGLPEQAKQIIPQSLELIEDIRHRNLHDMTLKELDDLAWEMYSRNVQVLKAHACILYAVMPLFNITQKLLERVDEGGTENLIFMGLEGMSSSQLGVEMWKVAESASRSPEVSELILSRRENVLEELEQIPEGQKFLKDFYSFVGKYGDRCSQEMELSIPRWEENPRFVLSMVANYLNSTTNPVETMEEQKRIKREATDRILRKLSKKPIEKLLFGKIFEKTQQYIVTRENLKTAWMRGYSAMRVVYLVIAEKLVEEKILESRDDIFYLKVTEVSDIITGSLERESVENRIRERRKEKEECQHLEVPMVIVGIPPPMEELISTVEPKDTLEGTICSFGVVTGKARVVLDPGECPTLEDGEILVVPYTDPGWSPLFVTAGGLVMEIGGALSHGVIIAREYGVPAVMGVKNATKIVKTGQIITVDGNKGMVYIKE